MKKIFLAIVMVALTTIFFSSCEKDEDQTCTLMVQNVSIWDAKIYLDGNYRATVYAKQTQNFDISEGKHTVEAVCEDTGQRIQESFVAKRGEITIMTLYIDAQ